MSLRTVGRFTFDPETSMVEGPGQYMDDQGSALLERMMAGEDTVFNMTCHLSPDAVTAVLVRLQTDFAGWKGMQQVHSWIGGKR